MAGHIPDSLSVDWCTPDEIVAGVHQVFGGPPALDPCSNPYSRVGAVQQWTLENGHDGLIEPWAAPTIYVNPPFGKGWWYEEGGKRVYVWPQERAELVRHYEEVVVVDPRNLKEAARLKAFIKNLTPVSIADWIKLCADAGDAGSDVIGLIPAYPGTKAFQKHVWKRATAVFFPEGRLHFRLVHKTPQGLVEKTGPAPMDCCLPYWGNSKLAEFKAVFEPLGHVVVL